MTKKSFLILTLFLLTFLFYSYYLKKNSGYVKIQSKSDGVSLEKVNPEITKFNDVEYKLRNEKNRVFTIRAKKAIVNNKKPDIINMLNVFSYLYLKNGSIVNINSDEGIYDRNRQTIKYYKNVKIDNQLYSVESNSAMFLSKANLIVIEENVNILKDTNFIKADKINIDTKTNNIEILMYSEKDKVYGETKK
jgi:hypothetical protein